MEKQNFNDYIENIKWRYNNNVDNDFAKNVIKDLETGDYWKCAIWFHLFGCVRTIGLNIKSYCKLTEFIDDLNPYEMSRNDFGWLVQNGRECLITTFEWERKIKKISAKIHIMVSPNEKYVSGSSYSYYLGGSYCSPSIWDKPFKTQKEAFDYEKDKLYNKLKRQGERNDSSKAERKEINKLLNILLNLKFDKWTDKPLPDNTTKAPPKTNYLSVRLNDDSDPVTKTTQQLSLF